MKADCLYIHIPFCIKKCLYCDFFSVPYDESSAKRYSDALCIELILKKDSINTLKTIYIGGGTPSLLLEECLKNLFKCLRDNFNLLPDIEITIEINPGTINKSKLNTILSLGVNRLSIGIQSFNDTDLIVLGRIHTSLEAKNLLEMIRKAGIHNFSIDLMYGIPGQTMDSWQNSLSKAAEFSPPHISTYELTLEEKTPLCKLIKSGEVRMPDEELILKMYNHTIDYLSSSGYEHYEISNFALSGFRCIHNLNYWDRGEYIGIGAGAHSFINEVRSKNTEDINAYIECLNNKIIPKAESTKITPLDAVKEFIFLGLRKREGIKIAKFKELRLNILNICEDLIDEGFLEIERGYLKLTRKGIVISNTIIVKLFGRLRLDS
ncbi:MAG: radical SAM family heme chaperone HemW [Nitrospirota bacterium]